MSIYIINLILSLLSALKLAYDQNIPGSLGWFCAALWIILLMIKKSKSE